MKNHLEWKLWFTHIFSIVFAVKTFFFLDFPSFLEWKPWIFPSFLLVWSEKHRVFPPFLGLTDPRPATCRRPSTASSAWTEGRGRRGGRFTIRCWRLGGYQPFCRFFFFCVCFCFVFFLFNKIPTTWSDFLMTFHESSIYGGDFGVYLLGFLFWWIIVGVNHRRPSPKGTLFVLGFSKASFLGEGKVLLLVLGVFLTREACANASDLPRALYFFSRMQFEGVTWLWGGRFVAF